MIKLTQLTYQYDDNLFYFDVTIKKQERVVVLGPSGAGKSTLLSLIAGFIAPQQGEMYLNGENMSQRRPGERPVSMLFQENNLFTHLTVSENIALGLKPSLKLSATENQALEQILARVGLSELAHRSPHQLSGGQRQRVALARCLLQHRPILLLDEPFSALDPALREEMLQLLAQVCQEYQLTLLMVSHHLAEVKPLAQRYLVIERGQIRFDGSLSELYSESHQALVSRLRLSSSQ